MYEKYKGGGIYIHTTPILAVGAVGGSLAVGGDRWRQLVGCWHVTVGDSWHPAGMLPLGLSARAVACLRAGAVRLSACARARAGRACACGSQFCARMRHSCARMRAGRVIMLV